MSSFEVIIRNSVELERVLSTNLSAKGPDLHAKLDSVRWRLSTALIAQVEYLIHVRNEAVNAAVVPDDTTEFKSKFASVIQAFERIVGSNAPCATTKLPESAKFPVITPIAERVEPVAPPMSRSMDMTALSGWQIAQQDTAIEEMLGALLTCGEHELGTSAPDKAPALIEICQTHDEAEARTPAREITIGALLLRPSLE
jgi:hypothetical protein